MRIQIAMVALAALTVSTPAMARGERTSDGTRLTAGTGTALQSRATRRSAQTIAARTGARTTRASSIVTLAEPAPLAQVTNAGCTFAICDFATEGNVTTIGVTEAGLASPEFVESVSFTNALMSSVNITFSTSDPDVNFLSLVLTGGGMNTIIPSTFNDGTLEQFGLSNIMLAANTTYTLTATGTNTNTGVASGTLTITSNPVPEPGTWAMMLIGFGAAGVGIRRSRRQNAKLLQIA